MNIINNFKRLLYKEPQKVRISAIPLKKETPNSVHPIYSRGSSMIFIPKGHQLYKVPHNEIKLDFKGVLNDSELVSKKKIKRGYINREHKGKWVIYFDVYQIYTNNNEWDIDAQKEDLNNLYTQIENYKLA